MPGVWSAEARSRCRVRTVRSAQPTVAHVSWVGKLYCIRSRRTNHGDGCRIKRCRLTVPLTLDGPLESWRTKRQGDRSIQKTSILRRKRPLTGTKLDPSIFLQDLYDLGHDLFWCLQSFIVNHRKRPPTDPARVRLPMLLRDDQLRELFDFLAEPNRGDSASARALCEVVEEWLKVQRNKTFGTWWIYHQ